MKRIFSAAAVLSMFAALGCSNAMTTPITADSAPAATPAHDRIVDKDVDADKATDAASETTDKADATASLTDATATLDTEKAAPAKLTVAPWGAGDFVVYRFTGSFHKTPVTLTEKVIARQGDAFTLDVTYDDGKTKDAFRAHMKGDSPMRAEVVSVARLVKGVEKAAPLSLYDEVFARVALATDQNEAQLGTESVKVDVAGHGTMACERATYRVKVGKETATMRTTESDAFAWGDVAAEITTAKGTLLYKAEVVDAGHESAKAPAVASADDDY